MKPVIAFVIIDVAILSLFAFVGFHLGQRVGAYKECRRQWTTVDTAPAVWEHCNRRFGIRPLQTGKAA
jgi:hypothetical protein